MFQENACFIVLSSHDHYSALTGGNKLAQSAKCACFYLIEVF